MARMTDPPSADGDTLGTSSLEFSDIYLADGAIIYLGLDQDTTLTHTADTGLFLNEDRKLAFRDQGDEYIYSVSDGNLGISAGTSLDLLSSIVDIGMSSTSDVTINLLGSTNSMAITFDESENKLAFDSTVLVVDGDDNSVGIGTASPATTLHVEGSTPTFRVQDSDTNYAFTVDGSVATGMRFHFGDMDATVDSFMSMGSWDDINRIDTAIRDFHLYGTNTTTGFYFDESEGRFGIGKTDPTCELDVSGTINATSISLGGTALTFSAAEINVIDGDTAATATTVVDADRVVYNDDGTMVQVAVTDLDTYFSATTKTLTNKTLTSPVLNTGVSGTAIKDEDTMTSDSDTHLATQQSIKAYVDSSIKTQEEIEDFAGGMFSGNTETLISATYDDASGKINLVVDNDLANYDNSTSGFITATLTQEQVEDYAGGMLSGNTETLITAAYDDASGKINLTVDNDLANYDNSSSGFITATLTQEQVEDFAGGMFSGNTETLISAAYDDASGKINLTVDNDLSNYDNSSSGFITATLTQEQVEDYAGGMFSGNTETLISVAYDDASGKINLTVDNDLSNYDNSTSGFITATLTQEQVEDYAGGMFSGNTETLISVAYDDASGKINLTVDNDLANYDNSSSGFITATLTQEQVEDFAGGMFSGNTETLISAAYDDASGKINLEVDNDLSNYDNSTSGFITATLTQEQVEDFAGGMFSGNTETLISAAYDDASGKINLTVDNDLSNYDNSSSGFITATLTQEQVEDFAGGMFSGNTETLISATYDDASGKMNLEVDNNLANYDNSTSGFITATLTQEQVEDFAGGMFSGNTETLISAAYDDASGKINLTVDNDLSNYDNSTSGFITSSCTTLSVSGDLTVDTETLKVDSTNGRVGIGLDAPLQPLHVYSNNNNSDPSVLIENDDAGGACAIGFLSGTSDNYTVGVAKVGTNFRICKNTNTNNSNSIVDIDRDYDNMGIGTNGSADASAVLELSSTSQGFLLPRMTDIERDAIASPAIGLIIYNTTSSKLNFYTGANWRAIDDQPA